MNDPIISSRRISFVLALFIAFVHCTKSDEATYTITIGAYTQDSLGNYQFTGNELIFHSEEECEIWSRTAPPDAHSSESHLHYNAAANKQFDFNSMTFSWTEFGPELDTQTIESTCNEGMNGTRKTVNDQGYYQDKPNLYLKITQVAEN